MKTQALSEGALLVSLCVIITSVGIIFPSANILLILTPLPFVILAARWDSQLSIIASIANTVILIGLLGPQIILFPLLFSGLIGVSMGAALEESFSPQLILAVGTGAVVISLGLNLAAVVYIFRIDVIGELAAGIEIGGEFSQQLGIDPETAEQLINQAIELLKNTYPALFLCVGLVVSTINYYFSYRILNRITETELSGLGFLTRFKLPRLIIVFYAASILLGGAFWQNVYIVLTFLLILEGGLVAYYYFSSYQPHGGLWVLFILFLIFFFQILLLVGVADLILDLRNLEKEEK